MMSLKEIKSFDVLSGAVCHDKYLYMSERVKLFWNLFSIKEVLVPMRFTSAKQLTEYLWNVTRYTDAKSVDVLFLDFNNDVSEFISLNL